MGNLETLESYRWPTIDFGLASIRVRMADLAARNHLCVFVWEEDGLGTAEGVMCRTSSGVVFLLQELQHAVKHFGRKGPDVFVDAEVLGQVGVEGLLREILSALNLSRDDLTWVQSPEGQAESAALGRQIRDYRKSRTAREA